MAFRFPLQAVLHLRKSVEHQQELRLQAANQRVGRVRQMIHYLDGSRQQLYSTQASELTAGTTAAELRFELQCAGELMRQRKELERQLSALELTRDRQLEILQQAKRARETLESVHDQQLSLYNRDALRREQRNLDDGFLMRREFPHRR
jgi:flagellar export protein FliJ